MFCFGKKEFKLYQQNLNVTGNDVSSRILTVYMYIMAYQIENYQCIDISKKLTQLLQPKLIMHFEIGIEDQLKKSPAERELSL